MLNLMKTEKQSGTGGKLPHCVCVCVLETELPLALLSGML